MQLVVTSNICFYYGEGVCNCDVQHLFLLWKGGMQLLVISNICFSIGRGYAIVGDIQHLFFYREGVCNCW